MIVSTPSTAAATESTSVMSPTTVSSRGWSAIGGGTRSKERTKYPRFNNSATRLHPTKPEPPVTMTLPRSVVSEASAMPGSITETCSNYEQSLRKKVVGQSSAPSPPASASSTRLRAPANCHSQRLASSSPLSQSLSDESRSKPPCSRSCTTSINSSPASS